MRTVKILCRSLLASYLISALLLTGLAFALFTMKISPSSVPGGVYAIYGISCFLGGLAAGKSTGSRKFFWGLLSGLFYFLLLALMSFLLSSGLEQDTQRLAAVLAVCAFCGMAGGMLG